MLSIYELPLPIYDSYYFGFVLKPLTSLIGSKCKRCGLYEEDTIKRDDVFDEWELCPSSFSLESEGRYIHFKDKEFNMTFACKSCLPPNASMSSHTCF